MTHNIRKEAPEGADSFIATDYDIKYYKHENGSVYHYIEGVGWVKSAIRSGDTNSLYISVNRSRKFVAIALVVLFGFVLWSVL